MPIWDRDWYRNWFFKGKHPPTCTCVDCTNARLIRLKKSGKSNFIPNLFRSKTDRRVVNKGASIFRDSRHKISTWLVASLLIFALLTIGLGISMLIRTFIPFWVLLGFSIVFSVEKWFKSPVRNRVIGRLYRLTLNLSILSLFGYLIWSGANLFSHKVVYSPLIGSLLFIFGFAFFIYMWRVVAKNSWRWPSMKLTVFSLICLFLVFSFAGVQPMANYKNKVVDSVTSIVGKWQERDNQEATWVEEESPEITTVEPPKVVIPEISVKPTLRNPSWEELEAFLWEDNTDQLEYVFPTFVCGDFAITLQSNAKKAGLRCAYVHVKLKGYPDWYNYGIPSNTGHGINAFETTDRGLVYIDCTGLPSGFGGPGNCDKIIDVKIGGEYIPRSVFPNLLGWRWVSAGTIVDIDIIQW